MRSVQISEYDILICMNHMGLLYFYEINLHGITSHEIDSYKINLHEPNAHICRQPPQIL